MCEFKLDTKLFWVVRINSSLRLANRQLVVKEGRKMNKITGDAVKKYEKENFFNSLDTAFSRLIEDQEEWDDYKKEMEAWDVTLNDGLNTEKHSQPY